MVNRFFKIRLLPYGITKRQICIDRLPGRNGTIIRGGVGVVPGGATSTLGSWALSGILFQGFSSGAATVPVNIGVWGDIPRIVLLVSSCLPSLSPVVCSPVAFLSPLLLLVFSSLSFLCV